MLNKGKIDTYVGSDGKSVKIAEMEKFHLVNAVGKMMRLIGANDERGNDTTSELEIAKVLKNEILNRMSH